jgi:hypothetical protein
MKQLLHIIMKAAPVGLELFAYQEEYLDRNYLERMQNHWFVLRTRCILRMFFSLYALWQGKMVLKFCNNISGTKTQAQRHRQLSCHGRRLLNTPT